MVCRPQSIRYHVRRTLQCVTVSETRMGRTRYTEFMTLPKFAEPNGGSTVKRLRSTLTTTELRHLIARLLAAAVVTAAFIRDWSRWRCELQATAAITHRKIPLYVQLQY